MTDTTDYMRAGCKLEQGATYILETEFCQMGSILYGKPEVSTMGLSVRTHAYNLQQQ